MTLSFGSPVVDSFCLLKLCHISICLDVASVDNVVHTKSLMRLTLLISWFQLNVLFYKEESLPSHQPGCCHPELTRIPTRRPTFTPKPKAIKTK